MFFVLGFNNTSTLVDHFVLSPREREKRDRKDTRRDEREGQGRKRNRNASEEIKIIPLYPCLQKGYQVMANWKPISVGCPGDQRFPTSLPHPTTQIYILLYALTLVTLNNLSLYLIT